MPRGLSGKPSFHKGGAKAKPAWQRLKGRKQAPDADAKKASRKVAKAKAWESEKQARAKRDEMPLSPKAHTRRAARISAYQAEIKRAQNAQSAPVPITPFDKLP